MIEKSDQHQQISIVGGPKLLYYNILPQQKGKGASPPNSSITNMHGTLRTWSLSSHVIEQILKLVYTHELVYMSTSQL